MERRMARITLVLERRMARITLVLERRMARIMLQKFLRGGWPG
jgi:hypothetical protein